MKLGLLFMLALKTIELAAQGFSGGSFALTEMSMALAVIQTTVDLTIVWIFAWIIQRD